MRESASLVLKVEIRIEYGFLITNENMGLCLYIRLKFVFGHTQSRRNVYSCQKKVMFTVFSIRSSFFGHLDSVILTSLDGWKSRFTRLLNAVQKQFKIVRNLVLLSNYFILQN